MTTWQWQVVLAIAKIVLYQTNPDYMKQQFREDRELLAEAVRRENDKLHLGSDR